MRCLMVVAYARDDEMLNIADHAHKCNTALAKKRANI
jgi:hypothetical protein